MTVMDSLTHRNATFVESGFDGGLKIIPSLKLLIVGCVDPRVDPFDIFGLAPGEAAIVRNVGGRITPDTLQTIAMLQVVAKAGGGALGPGWNLIVLHHTDCGINRLTGSPDLLATYFGVSPAELDDLAITDPHRAVAVDVATLRLDVRVPSGFIVTGVVYDVDTGRIEVVIPSAPLRAAEPA